MQYFMEPTGVAIIGASQDLKTINGKILKYLLKHKYKGQIYPVNPKYKEIEGLACYPSVGAIPEQVDLALIAVAAARVPGILRDCGAKGVKRAVIFSSGFAETGTEGKEIQEEINKIAQEFQMRLIGPNCLGILNVSAGLIASFSASMEVGVIQAKDSDDVIDLSQAFVPGKLPLGAKVGIVTMSGGVGILLADRSEEWGLQVPELSETLQEEVRMVIPAFGCAQNPVDVTAQSLNQGEEFKKCLKILLASEELDMLIVAITMATGKLAEKIGQDIVEAALGTEKPLVVSWSVGQVAKPGFDVLKDAGVPLYHSPARAAKALGALYRYSIFKRAWRVPVATEINQIRQAKIQLALRENTKALSEHATKELLELYGLPVTKEYVAKSGAEAVIIAEKMGYPVVMKIDSSDILHKTEAGGVAVNISSAQEIEAKFNEIMEKGLVYNPQAKINGVLVQEQVQAGVEVIIGLQRDLVLGTQIMFGLGGIFVEVLKDVVLKPVPLSREDAYKMLQEIKGTALLNGVRGRRAVDLEALVEILMGVSQLAVEAGETLLSLDINPVTVLEQGNGAKILDGVLVGN